MRGQWKKLLVVLLVIGLLGANTITLAEESAQGRRFSILSISGDEAYVTRGATKEVKATAGMPLGQGSKVRTGAQTSLYVQADDDKTIKLDSNTQAEITKVSSKSLKITLKSGEMFFNVEKPIKSGEELTFDAAQTSMSIRGTSGILAYSENNLTFYLVEGDVQWKIGNETIDIKAGQKVVLVPSSGEQLQANGMNSMYRLQGVEDFSWSDLSAMGLEAVIEQGIFLDLSAIGLENEEMMGRAQDRLIQIKQEKVARERAQAEREKQAREASGGYGTSENFMRIDGKEPEIPRNSGSGQLSNGGRRETAAVPAPTEPPTTGDVVTESPTIWNSTTESSPTGDTTTESPTIWDSTTESSPTGDVVTESPTIWDSTTESSTAGDTTTESPTTEESPTESSPAPSPPEITEEPTETTEWQSPQTSAQSQNALIATP